ncbi:4-alpha-glucanotransferase [Shewanella sp. 4_MG-2023]|uniref:4-alpha-glucanotransferase n=1 Tax=Shewanella sp. 4_MG-2023 TaxID=3062652 RepID=UPI0026E1954F|nr:4-alpha-glucanotransferase [Shewanella sp. 4_MG-2023]MDO6678880.1 4-alpha-glucanotransferase [Shewanella sp. 4_MG-2023]
MGLGKLLYLQGVGAEFIDCFGNNVQIQPLDRNGILQSMCVNDASTKGASTSDTLNNIAANRSFVSSTLSDEFIQQRIFELDAAPWLQPLHGFQWSYVDDPIVEFHLPEHFTGSIKVEIEIEHGDKFHFPISLGQMRVVGDYGIDGISYLKYQYQLNDDINAPLGLGYHGISATVESASSSETYTGQLMIAPRSAYVHADSKTAKWGLSTQLYSLTSQSQWGIGDFNDLQKLIELAAAKGADFILLNPLHALDLPESASPYSPSDRRRLNPLYIHIESVAEYAAIEGVITSKLWRNKQYQLAQSRLLDYCEIHETKFSIYQMLFNAFIKEHKNNHSKRYLDFACFKQQQGEGLSQYVTHQQQRNSCFTDAEFLCYLQFIAYEQLLQCQAKAKTAGMSLGLIRDMAVGASPTGAEVCANIDNFCINANIGAPPDPFAPQGQNWGLTPFDPIKLAQHKFEHFIDLIRSNMVSCGGLRIDHVMGLLRLWWWPKQEGLGNGAYVYYPLDTLLAILCLESQRAQCVLIGEDLGIVPPEIVANLAKAKIFSNELFYFAKHHDGFMNPAFYKSHSLMMLANHDVPTLTAWWTAADIELRHQLNLYDNEQQLDEAKSLRLIEKQQLLDLLSQHHLIKANIVMGEVDFEQLMLAWLQLSASGNSALYSIQIDDLIDEVKPINIPGTWKQYPNWCRRLSRTLEQISADSTVNNRLDAINKTRRSKYIDDSGKPEWAVYG